MTQTKKYLTNEGTVQSYFRNEYENGYAYGESNSNIYFIGDKLFSYGSHFILAQLHEGNYFVNADSYSSSTGKHQSFVQRYVPSRDKIEIPFSALESAGIRVSDISVIEKEDSKYIEIEKKGEMEKVHLMGSTLFTANGNYYLSGIDETAKDLWKGFFLTQLVGQPTTVEEAYETMKPEMVKMFEHGGLTVKRQGEYFFSEVTNEDTLAILNRAEKKKEGIFGSKVALMHQAHDQERVGWEFRNSRHVVTKYVKLGDVQFAKGTCRHIAGEHRMLKLEAWHLVIENVQVQSWASAGRVD